MFRLAALLLLVLPAAVQAAPPPMGSEDWAIMEDFRDWVVTQHAANGQWCCDISDGRPLGADEVRVAGDHYEILYGRKHWPDGTDNWITVPKTALLERLSPVGYVIAWVSSGRVYCLALVGAS